MSLHITQARHYTLYNTRAPHYTTLSWELLLCTIKSRLQTWPRAEPAGDISATLVSGIAVRIPWNTPHHDIKVRHSAWPSALSTFKNWFNGILYTNYGTLLRSRTAKGAHLCASSKQKSCIIVGVTQSQSTNWTFYTFHRVVDRHARCDLERHKPVSSFNYRQCSKIQRLLNALTSINYTSHPKTQ